MQSVEERKPLKDTKWRNPEYKSNYFKKYYENKGKCLETCSYCERTFTHSHRARHLNTIYCKKRQQNCDGICEQ